MKFIITKLGKLVAKLIPIEKSNKKKTSLYGCMKNSVVIKTDIVRGIHEKWKADA